MTMIASATISQPGRVRRIHVRPQAISSGARGRQSTPLYRLGQTELRSSLSRCGRPDSALETTAGDW